MTRYHLNLQGEESASVDFVLGPYGSIPEADAARDRIADSCPGVVFAPVTESHDVAAWVSVVTTEDDAVEFYREFFCE